MISYVYVCSQTIFTIYWYSILVTDKHGHKSSKDTYATSKHTHTYMAYDQLSSATRSFN